MCTATTLNDTIRQVKVSLKQKDGLAPMLFNLVLEHAITGIPLDANSTVMTKSQHIIGYADYLNIIGKSITSIIEYFLRMEDAVQGIGLKVNKVNNPK